MKTYTGSRTIDGVRVLVDGVALDARTDLKRFSNAGFEWTYRGSAPAQLALALLADHLGDGRKLCDAFMRDVVADLDNDWALTSEEIDEAVAGIENPEAGTGRPVG